MIVFNIEIGGQIKIYSMNAEEAGKIEMPGMLKFFRDIINTSIGVHGCLAVQVVPGTGNLAIPNDIRFVLDNLNVGYSINKTEGFEETQPEPIPADEVR